MKVWYHKNTSSWFYWNCVSWGLIVLYPNSAWSEIVSSHYTNLLIPQGTRLHLGYIFRQMIFSGRTVNFLLCMIKDQNTCKLCPGFSLFPVLSLSVLECSDLILCCVLTILQKEVQMSNRQLHNTLNSDRCRRSAMLTRHQWVEMCTCVPLSM